MANQLKIFKFFSGGNEEQIKVKLNDVMPGYIEKAWAAGEKIKKLV